MRYHSIGGPTVLFMLSALSKAGALLPAIQACDAQTREVATQWAGLPRLQQNSVQ